MKKLLQRALLVIGASGFCLGGSALAEEQSNGSTQSPWDFQFAPYLWATSVSSDLTVIPASTRSPINAETSADFSDLLPDLKGGFLGHFEARNGDWGILSDAIYLKLAPDGQVPPFSFGPVSFGTVNVDVEVEAAILELGGFYRFGEWEINNKGTDAASISLEGLAGLRYTYIDIDVNITTQLSGPLGLRKRQVEADLSPEEDFLDPIFGARLIVEPDPDWLLSFRGDIGGFGVGSELTWNLAALVGYRAWENVTLVGGYRAMFFEFEGGIDAADVELELLFQGPLLAAVFYF